MDVVACLRIFVLPVILSLQVQCIEEDVGHQPAAVDEVKDGRHRVSVAGLDRSHIQESQEVVQVLTRLHRRVTHLVHGDVDIAEEETAGRMIIISSSYKVSLTVV